MFSGVTVVWTDFGCCLSFDERRLTTVQFFDKTFVFFDLVGQLQGVYAALEKFAGKTVASRNGGKEFRGEW